MIQHAKLIERLRSAPEWIAQNGKLEKLLAEAADALQAMEPDNAWKGCDCRWDSEDIRVRTCERHQG